jgi:hypothetical protein
LNVSAWASCSFCDHDGVAKAIGNGCQSGVRIGRKNSSDGVGTGEGRVGIGDIVKLMWGSNEWVCGEIIDTTSSNNEETYYPDPSNVSMIRYELVKALSKKWLEMTGGK